jgi:hypothetical protein
MVASGEIKGGSEGEVHEPQACAEVEEPQSLLPSLAEPCQALRHRDGSQLH